MFAKSYTAVKSKTSLLVALVGASCLLGTATIGAKGTTKSEEPALTPLASIAWKDARGNAYDQSKLAAHKATVFLFVSTQCPIANLYTPRINALVKDYTPRDVQFFVVDSNSEDSLQTFQRYAKERNFTCPIIKDNGTALADRLAADHTPEAIIVDNQALVRYRGRIDDNADRDKVIRNHVREALDAMLAGKPIERARTIAFGCTIFRDNVKPAAASAGTVTYTRDVAPILYGNCVSCHRPGDSGPFSLATYHEARTWATGIKEYTARHLMPPWKAVPGYGDFHDARVLTPTQIATLARWADTGAHEGNPRDLPTMPHYESAAGWKLGTPDAVLQSDRPYHLAADGKDVYRNYVIPMSADEDRYIKAIEFKASNRAIVHHIIVFFDLSGKSVDLARASTDGEPGYSVPGTSIGTPEDQTVWVAGWAPGNTCRFLPEGTAFKLPKGAKVVVQVHYHKDGKVEQDQSQVAFYYTDKKSVDKEIYTAAVAYPFLLLKPGDAHQTVHATQVLHSDYHIWAVLPHMHMLGHEIKMTATLPDGTVKPMIYIDNWDFNWQETYRYKEPLALPKGTKVELTATFDNSEQNPHQPTHPPKTVSWGEQTTDEMCIGFFQLTVDHQHLLSKETPKTAQSAAPRKPADGSR